MKNFLQLAIVGLFSLAIAATPYGRVRRQLTTAERRNPTFVSGDFSGFSQFDQNFRGTDRGSIFDSGFQQRQQEDDARALNELFIRDERQTQNDFIFPQQFTSSTTGRPSAGRTTSSPEFLTCLERCPSVNQYNPVCGSDGETYHNEYRLECSRRCGLTVELVRGGSCLPVTSG